MSILLDLDPIKLDLIKDVCVFEHESLMRLHVGKSPISDQMSTILDELGVTEDEYLSYSSEAFFEFQKVLEDPTQITEMPPVFMAVFILVCNTWQDDLSIKYGDVFYQFREEVKNLASLKPSNLNFN
jgi:hypothetical protein